MRQDVGVAIGLHAARYPLSLIAYNLKRGDVVSNFLRNSVMYSRSKVAACPLKRCIFYDISRNGIRHVKSTFPYGLSSLTCKDDG